MSKKGSNDAVRVMVRVRPFNAKEIRETHEAGAGELPFCTLSCPSDTLISCTNPENPEDVHNFPFDKVFWSMTQVESSIPFADQPDIFAVSGSPALDSAFDGYNGCIFAYGQTASGKTHTMMGQPDNAGIIPRLCQLMFDRINNERAASQGTDGVESTVAVSFLEIYNEKVLDLLAKTGKGHSFDKPLPVMTDPEKGPVVKGLTVTPVSSWAEVEAVLTHAQQNRSTASTLMNLESSRSHAIVQLSMTRAEIYGKVGNKEVRREKRSRINLVDLAGSEKVLKSGVTGANLKEAININQSLTCLGRVIDQLIQPKIGHIPYRDSVLTTLLSDSLGGNSRTTMFAALSPAAVNYEETMSTLRWASRARQVVNVVRVNMDPAQLMIQQLQAELLKYKEALFEGKITPELEAQAAQYGKEISQVLVANSAQAEAMIEQLARRGQQEEEELRQREARWDEERQRLLEKHARDLSVLRAEHRQLQDEQDRLQAEHLDLKRKGIIERFRRAGMAGQIEAQKLKQEEAQKRVVSEKMKGFVSRVREINMKNRLKDMEEQLTSSHAKVEELEAELARLRSSEGTTGGEEGSSGAAADSERVPEPPESRSSPAMDERTMNGEHRISSQQQLPCDMCMEHPGLFLCTFAPCCGAVLCKDCDADQHRGPKMAHHQRSCVYTAAGSRFCEFCGVRTPSVVCEGCDGAWFCTECNLLKHHTQKWAHHQWRELTEADWRARGVVAPAPVSSSAPRAVA
eukprot:RCo037891